MAAHAIGTDTAQAPTTTPTSVKVMRNIDIVVLAVALVIFLVAGFEILGWITGAAAWAAQRLIGEFATSRAKRADDVRTRVGLLAGSMILRGWLVAGIIIAVGVGNEDAGLGAAVLFLAVFTMQLTMTMSMRPFEDPGTKITRVTKKGPAR